jgi:rhodanese-related sulfurtransferase
MANIQNISSAEAKKLLHSNEAILIDVREPAEHRSEKIPSAQNIPLSRIQSDHIMRHKNKKVILHCKAGKRSEEACQKVIQDLDFDIYKIEGGIDAWSASGMEIEKGAASVLPLNQQVQLTIGIMILTGLALFQFVTPYGLILPLIAGLGLINAGLTGWCGLAKAMAMMPWNK